MRPEEEKALKASFRLLKFRMRTRAELTNRLLAKGFSESIVDTVVRRLEAKRYLDDKLFAVEFIQAQMRRNYGPRMIKRELIQKGLSEQLIEEQLGKLRPEETLLEFAQKKFSSYRGVDPDAALRKLYTYLLHRGFTPERVEETCEKLCETADNPETG